jgi:hypothetical protein
MQAGMQDFVDSIDRRLACGEGSYRHYDEEEHFWPADRAYVTNNAFKYSPDLVRLCCNASLVEAANHYLGKRAFVQRGVGMRYLPVATPDHDMFGWHHDMEERRFKVMVLLSDVSESDQHMSYVIGSHQLYHPYTMFFDNVCSLEYCRRHLEKIEIYDAVGLAGDVFVFDSNGAHRGNRRPTARVRDVFLVEFTGDRSDVWGGDVDPRLLETIGTEDNPFERMVTAEKKWNRPTTRQAPTWVENLPHVERWV